MGNPSKRFVLSGRTGVKRSYMSKVTKKSVIYCKIITYRQRPGCQKSSKLNVMRRTPWRRNIETPTVVTCDLPVKYFDEKVYGGILVGELVSAYYATGTRVETVRVNWSH